MQMQMQMQMNANANANAYANADKDVDTNTDSNTDTRYHSWYITYNPFLTCNSRAKEGHLSILTIVDYHSLLSPEHVLLVDWGQIWPGPVRIWLGELIYFSKF